MNYTLRIIYEGGRDVTFKDLPLQKALLRIKQAHFFGNTMVEILLIGVPAKAPELNLEGGKA